MSEVLQRLLALDEAQRRWLLSEVEPMMREEYLERWAEWAQKGQQPKHQDWKVWLIQAGRGFGKTRAGAEWVHEIARENPRARIALVGATIDDARRVMVEGVSGLLNVAWAEETPVFRRSALEVSFDSGAIATLYSAEAPEGLRGPEHNAAWCDELGKWGRGGEAAWDNLMLGLRLDPGKAVVSTTPRATPLMRRVKAITGLHETFGRTADNRYLPAGFAAMMAERYGTTRLGRQELDGELIEELTGALWSRTMIEAGRVTVAPALVRVVVGVDPPAGEDGDACGIVAVGLGEDACGYVLADASVSGASPEGWARAVASCAARHGADRVVAEANQGGSMVRSVLLAADAALPVTLVHASRGKAARAEPVAALYERGRVRHVGMWRALEDELCGIVAGGGAYGGPGRSPDRADALVWAVTALMLGRKGDVGVRGV